LWREGQEIEVEYQGKILRYKKWSETAYEQPKIQDCKEIAVGVWNRKPKKPGKYHPWR